MSLAAEHPIMAVSSFYGVQLGGQHAPICDSSADHYATFLWWVFDALGGRQPCTREYARTSFVGMLDAVDVGNLARYIRFLRQKKSVRRRLCLSYQHVLPSTVIHRQHVLDFLTRARVSPKYSNVFMRILTDTLGYLNVTTKRERARLVPFLSVFV